MGILNTWQFNLIGYLFGIVIFFQFYKLAVRNAQRDGAATVLLQTIAGVSILCLVPFLPMKFSSDIRVYVLLFLACIFYGLNDRLQTTSRKHLQVSIFSILGQLSTVFLILIGLTIFREPFFLIKVFGAILILFANILLFYKKGTLTLNKYAWMGILATLILSVALSIDIDISKQFNLPIYIMFTFIIPAIIIFFGEKIKLSEVIKEFKSPDIKNYFITGIAWGLTVFFSLRSFQFGKVTTIVPLQAISVLINVLIAYFFFGEKKDEWKKIIAAILVIIGIVLTVGIFNF
jgi:uncharacterized membrane protein